MRKYLLRLRQEHVKFWRPQILLFINNPRHQYKLIQFCNSLKKGALFVLGHVIVAPDFGSAVPEARRQQAAWTKYIDFSKVKAFVNIAISPAVEWGARNIVLSAGLGGMRPNIVIMGAYNLDQYRADQPLVDLPSPQLTKSTIPKPSQDGLKNRRRRRRGSKTDKLEGMLPTDTCRTEGAVSATSYLNILEDLLLRVQINVAVAKGFQDLELPSSDEDGTKQFIDLWPIQMSAEIASEGGEHGENVLTTNFDTYTLILQLGCILNTVPSWKRAYKLRVAVFVEYESDVEEERGRVETLLENLRIEAQVLVFSLASGEFKTYELIVNGDISKAGREAETDVNACLKDEEWWQDVRKARGQAGEVSAAQELTEGLLESAPTWPSSSFQGGRRESNTERFDGLRRLLHGSKRRATMSGLHSLGVSIGMRTHRLHEGLMQGPGSASEDSDSSTSSDDDSEGSSTSSNLSDSRIKLSRRRSVDNGFAMPRSRKKTMPGHPRLQGASSNIPDIQIQRAPASDSALQVPKSNLDLESGSSEDEVDPMSPVQRHHHRSSSGANFTSSPVPKTKVAPDDEHGPSIMFSEDSPTRERQRSIYTRQSSSQSNNSPSRSASGFPSSQAVPLSFNDLPCRAQHMILNELMSMHTGDTAVVFTTLPSPVEGTYKSEEESLRYLSDLEVLCQGLPPTLLVHSNSMTVTMNL